MEKHRALLLGIFLLLLAVEWSLAESQADVSGKSGEDPRNVPKRADVVSNPTKVDKDNKGEEAGGNDNKPKKEVADNGSNKNGLGSKSEPKESGDGAKGEVRGDKNGQLGDENGSNERKKDSGSEAGSNSQDKGDEGGAKVQLSPPKDEITSVDGECDPFTKCTIKPKKLVACLRQTGHESPEFSLLVRNKGNEPLDITISGPDSVRLENKTFQLQGKHEQQVKVELEAIDGGGNNLIVLEAGNKICNLNLTDLMARISEKKIDSSPKFSTVNFMSRIPVIALASFAALLILASACTCCFCKNLHSKNGSKYRRIEMELPVSGAGKTEPEVSDGWDNNWGDDWDDEEAPLTPSMPVTPNPSSKGLASRRLNKERWKD